MRRDRPNILAAGLAGLWLLLFLVLPQFMILQDAADISRGVNGIETIRAVPAALLMLIPGALMLVCALLLNKIIGMITAGITFVLTLIFGLGCQSIACAPYAPRGFYQTIWGAGMVILLLLSLGVLAAELLLGGDGFSRPAPTNNDDFFD